MSLTDLYYFGDGGGPSAPPDPIVGSSAESGSIAYGGFLGLLDAAQSAQQVFRYPDFRTPVASLSAVASWEWQDELSQSGTASIEIPLSHADADAIQPDDLIRHSLKGRAAFTSTAQKLSRTTLEQAGGDGQRLKVNGPGHLAQFADAVVMPSRGPDVRPVETTRPFNWTSPSYRVGRATGWRVPYVLNTYGYLSTYWYGLEGWTDPDAMWVSTRGSTAGYSPTGISYARAELPCAVDGKYWIQFAADDLGKVYLDGQLIITAGQWDNQKTYDSGILDLTAGYHTVAVEWEQGGPEGDAGPGGFLLTAFAVNAVGFPQAPPILESGPWPIWTVSEYPTGPPGMTVGEIILICIDEAQDAGLLPGWVCSFDTLTDSNGEPWTVSADIATEVGRDLRTFFCDELAQTYCDLRAQPGGLVLDAYNFGTMGTDLSSSVALHSPTDPTDPTSGNLTQLTHDVQSPTATRLLVKWPGGWHEVDATPPGARPKQALFGLGYVPSIPELVRVARQQLAAFADVRTAIQAGIWPQSDDEIPGRGFHVGDTITVPDVGGSPVTERVRSISVRTDENAVLTYGLELKDKIQEFYEGLASAIKKMSDGTMRGASLPASPVSQVPTAAPNCCPPTVTGVGDV